MIMNEMEWKEYGINISGQKLAFADDVVLMGTYLTLR